MTQSGGTAWVANNPKYCRKCLSMSALLLTLSHHTSVRIAEIAFLLIVIAGVWMIAAELLQPERWMKVRMVVAGACFVAAGVLLLIATHWGQFG